MPLPFDAREKFRTASTDLLKSYFARRAEPLDLPWDAFTLGRPDPAYEAWCERPEIERDLVLADWRAVAEVGTPAGVRLLADEARNRGVNLGPQFQILRTPWEQALWVFVRHREVFHVALQFDRADHLHARYWRQRAEMPRRAPDISPETLAALGSSIAVYYREREKAPRARPCRVRHLVRSGTLHYFVAFPQDAPTLFERYDDLDDLILRCEKLPFRVVFVFDPATGTLRLHARGDRRMHFDLQRIFARVVLRQELPPETAAAPLYRLHLLKHRDFAFPVEPKDGIEQVRVKALRVRALGGGAYVVDAEELQKRKDVYAMLDGTLRGNDLPLANVDVARATLQMVFRYDRPRVLPISLTPSWCSLGHQPIHEVARRCLAAAGLACA